MASDNDNNQERPRRGSVGNAVFSNIFQRSNSLSTAPNVFPSAAVNANDAQRRRLSISTLGLHGASPPGSVPFGLRRGSLSTNSSDVIDENAVDDDDAPSANPKTTPTAPFARRMSFGTNPMRNYRSGGASPGSGNRPPASFNSSTAGGGGGAAPAAKRNSTVQSSGAETQSPLSTSVPGGGFSLLTSALSSGRRASGPNPHPTSPHHPHSAYSRSPSNAYSPRSDQHVFNWSEQLRSRAESSVSGARPSFSFGSGLSSSPPRAGINTQQHHPRQNSTSEMPAPPVQAASLKPKQPERPKPDHFQERILKGDFYMD